MKKNRICSTRFLRYLSREYGWDWREKNASAQACFNVCNACEWAAKKIKRLKKAIAKCHRIAED